VKSSRFEKYKGPLRTLLIALAVGGLVIWYETRFFEWDRAGTLRMISDGLFVPGIFLTCFGVMLLVADAGGFDALGFLGHSMVSIFSPRKNKFEARMNYLEYKMERQKKRIEHGKPPVYIPLIGVVLLVLSIILAVI
jgi:hypothetical protein